MRQNVLLICLALAGCGGKALNTTLADDVQVRAAMVDSVIIGTTTETAFIGRWGRPVQTLREGAQVSYIYRNIGVPKGGRLLRYGDSARFVIVDFQYGIATGIRTTDDVFCRATFPPWPTDYVIDNPSTVHPAYCTESKAVLYPVPAGDAVSGGVAVGGVVTK